MLSLRVLVVGAGGVFGERLAARLLAHGLSLLFAGRTRAKSELAADRLRISYPAARIEIVTLDRTRPDTNQLRVLAPFAIVDAAGPFQGAGYALAEAAIAVGAHYIDLADAREFVTGIGVLDPSARSAGVLVATGASSVPALTMAALDQLVASFATIDSIEVALSPGNRAPRGASVVESVLAQAGQPLRVFQDGVWTTADGWSRATRIDMPRLGRRWVSLCDVPDLDLAVSRYAPNCAALFRAGLELRILHGGLGLLSWLVRLRVVGSLRPLAGILRRFADLFRPFGTDRGGLVVEVVGKRHDGAAKRARWWLAADGGDGPTVPTLAATALIRALAEGRVQERGAMPCIGLVSLDDILREASGLCIATGFDRPDVRKPGLYGRVMGAAFDRLADSLRSLHARDGPAIWSGRAEVQSAGNIFAALVRRVMGFPSATPDCAVQVSFARGPHGETWMRDFAGVRFTSRLTHDASSPYRIEEHFGPFAFRMRLPLSHGEQGQGLAMEMDGWRLGPLLLPNRLAPRIRAVEQPDAKGRFTFDVDIGLPILGRLVRYRGWLEPGDHAHQPERRPPE